MDREMIKFAEEIAKEMESKDSIVVPNDYVTGEEHQKEMRNFNKDNPPIDCDCGETKTIKKT